MCIILWDFWVLNTNRFLGFTLDSGFRHLQLLQEGSVICISQLKSWLIFSSWACVCLFIKHILLIVSHRASATSEKICKLCTVRVKTVKWVPLWMGTRKEWYRNKGDIKQWITSTRPREKWGRRSVGNSLYRTSGFVPSDFFSLHGEKWNRGKQSKRLLLEEQFS